jgi:hypothetical protein
MVVGLGFQNVTLMQKADFLIRGVVVASGFDVDVHNEGEDKESDGESREYLKIFFLILSRLRRLFDSLNLLISRCRLGF